MNHLRHDFLAGPRLAKQKDGGGRRRHLFDLRDDPLDGGAVGNQRTRGPQHLHITLAIRVLQRHPIAQPADLVERLLQRVVSRLSRKRLTDHAGDQAQTFDHRRRPLLIARRRAEREGVQHRFRIYSRRKRNQRSGAKAAATKRIAIRLG